METSLIIFAILAALLYLWCLTNIRGTVLFFFAFMGYANLEFKVDFPKRILQILVVITTVLLAHVACRTDMQTLVIAGKFFGSMFLAIGLHEIFMDKYFCAHNTKEYPFRRI